MKRRWMGLCLGVLLCTVSIGYADERRGSPSRQTSIGRALARGSLTVIGAGMGSRYLTASPLTSQGSVK
jgi:hypothetical protein